MTNLGLHLRHNFHPTLLIYTRTTLQATNSRNINLLQLQHDLHLHDTRSTESLSTTHSTYNYQLITITTLRPYLYL
jgi:hypothetical protein